jgi:hypothetical protein
MVKFFLIKQVQHNYDIDKLKSYWTNQMKDTLTEDANPQIHIISAEIDNLLGKNTMDVYSSNSSNYDSDESDTDLNKTVNIVSRKFKNSIKLLDNSGGSKNEKEKAKDTQNLNKTSKFTKKMLDHMQNPVNNSSTMLNNQKLIRGVKFEFNDSQMLKRETMDTSTKSSVKNYIYINNL